MSKQSLKKRKEKQKNYISTEPIKENFLNIKTLQSREFLYKEIE